VSAGIAKGVRYFVESTDDVPVVWFDIAIRGGAAADPIGVEGLHRHAGLLARRGAGDRRRAVLDETLDALGATLEVAVGRDAMSLSGLCLRRNLDQVLELAGDILAAPRFDTDEHQRLLRETPQILDEVRDDDSALATRWFDHQCCPGHIYGRTSLGTAASIAAITHEASAEMWRREVVPDNLIVGIAGAVRDEAAEGIVTRLAERLPQQLAPALPAVTEFRQAPVGRRLVIVDKADRTQAQLRFGHLSARWGDPDTLALVLAETAFGGMFSSRLMQEIRVKRGWSYGAGCSLRRSRGPHWFELWMATGIEVAAEAVTLTHQLFAELAHKGPTSDELALARSYLIGAMPFHTATARMRMQLAVRDATFDLPFGYTAEMPRLLPTIDFDEVRAACARQLQPESLVTVAVTTADSARSQLEALRLGPVTVVAHDDY
jgi:zinc protease